MSAAYLQILRFVLYAILVLIAHLAGASYGEAFLLVLILRTLDDIHSHMDHSE